MFKILLLGLNFLNFNYSIIKEIVTNYEEIIYQDESYIIYSEGNNLKLKTTNDEWIRDLNLNKNIYAFLVNNDIYIFNYNNNILRCLRYSKNGNLVFDKQIFNNKIKNIKIKYSENFYIIGSINEKTDPLFKIDEREDLGLLDGFILELDLALNILNSKTFGGILNEEFFDLEITNDSIYIAGKKDMLTGGDFGNGGKTNGDIFICRLNKDLTLQNKIIFNDIKNIVRLKHYKDIIYLCSEQAIYKLDLNLVFLNSNILKEKAVYMVIANFNKLIILGKQTFYIYDLISLRLIACIENESEITNVREFSNILYIDNYYFDLISTEDMKYFSVIYQDFEPKHNVSTIFGPASFIEEVSEVVFDPLVYGLYNRRFKYININGNSFYINIETKVNKEANVSEGGIYPVGYNLLFTGKAYLNGNSIANNYAISHPGVYTLKLVGNNLEEYEINFKIDANQILFSEIKEREYNNIASVGDIYYINIQYENEINEIMSVVIDGIEYFDILIKKNERLISIKMNSKLIPGLYYHLINGINYKEDSIIRYINLDEVYLVNIIKKPMSLLVDKINNYKYYCELEDNNTARYFMVSYIYNNQEYNLKYPIASNKISLDNLPNREIIIINLAIYYDLGNKSYQKIDLMDLKFLNISDNNILEIDVYKKEESLKEFEIKIRNEKGLQEVKINNTIVFMNLKKDYTAHLIIGGILFFLFFSITYGIKNRLQKKKI